MNRSPLVTMQLMDAAVERDSLFRVRRRADVGHHTPPSAVAQVMCRGVPHSLMSPNSPKSPTSPDKVRSPYPARPGRSTY